MDPLSSNPQDVKYVDYPQEWHDYRNRFKQYVEREGPQSSCLNRALLKGLEDMTLEKAQQLAEDHQAGQRELQRRREVREQEDAIFKQWLDLSDDPLENYPSFERHKTWMVEHTRKFGPCPAECFHSDINVRVLQYYDDRLDRERCLSAKSS